MQGSRGARTLVPLALALAGCGGGASADGDYFGATERVGKDPGTLYLNNGNEPEYLDPGKQNDSASGALINQMFEGLTSYAPGDLRPTQGVATHWEQSDDNRLYRFHLRPEARWSDGKPVTAHDFAYAWKRVLRPATAATSATNLHVLKNGEPFNLGKLKALRADVVLRTGPGDGAPAGAALPKGAFVEILARSPMKVATRIAPLAAVPQGVTAVSQVKADAKSGAPEKLVLEAPKDAPAPIAADPAGGWADAEVQVLGAGAPVECNGTTDRWYQVERAGARGFLPGCLLSVPKGSGGFALVAHFTSLPNFGPSSTFGAPGRLTAPSAPIPAAPPPPEAEPKTGFVPMAELVEDDGAVGVRATDDHTLEVELERPTPYFTDLTSYPTLYPVRQDVIEKFERRGEPELWFRPENIVVNGPFTLESWKFRYEITMKRNPHYWDRDRLKLSRIVWLEVEHAHASMNLYKAGDLDYLGDNVSLPTEYVQPLSSKKDFRRTAYLATYWYEFNVTKPPVDDVRVRRALNLALDKQQIVEKITRGGQQPATHYVPDFTGGGYADQAAEDRQNGVDPFSEFAFDPARGRALLEEAGYKVVREGDGFRAVGFPPLELLYNTSEGHKQIAVAVQDMWKRHLGISASLRNEEWRVMLKNARDGHFQVVRFGWTGEYNHPLSWLNTMLSYSTQNRTRWADKEFDDLVRKGAATADPKEAIATFRKAELRAVEQMARLPMYFYTRSTLVKPWVKGYVGNARNAQFLKWFWIDPDYRENPTNDIAYPPLEFPKPGRLVGAGAAGVAP